MIKRALILCLLIGCDGSFDPNMPEADAGTDVIPDPRPGLCQLTANDTKTGVALKQCQDSDLTTRVKHGVICYICYAEFITPADGCYTYPGSTASRLCVPDCSICDR